MRFTGGIFPPAPLPARSITAAPGGGAYVEFEGVPGLTYAIQTTTNFVDWLDLWTNTATGGGVFGAQDTNVSLPFRFYRSLWR